VIIKDSAISENLVHSRNQEIAMLKLREVNWLNCHARFRRTKLYSKNYSSSDISITRPHRSTTYSRL